MKAFLITCIIIGIILIAFTVIKLPSFGETENRKQIRKLNTEGETNFIGTKKFWEKSKLWYYTVSIYKNDEVMMRLYVPGSDDYKRHFPEVWADEEYKGYKRGGKLYIENKDRIGSSGHYYWVDNGTYDSISYKLANGKMYRLDDGVYDEYFQASDPEYSYIEK